MKPKKIALFGGSFNPVHNSHLQIAQACLKKKLVDEVWFIPCMNHPFDKDLISAEDRIAMLALAIDKNKKLKINSIETSRFVSAQSPQVSKSNLDGAQEPEHAPDFSPRVLDIKITGKSYTIDTLRELKAKYSHKFYLVIGSDNLEKIEKWHEFSSLVQETEFILASRPSYSSKDTKNLKIFAIIEEGLNESSTQVRELIKKGQSISSLVPKEIENYIKLKGLYK